MNKRFLCVLFCFILLGCSQENKPTKEKFSIVTTTTMITDLVQTIAGQSVDVIPLMQNGIDPHSYKAKESDVLKLIEADLIVYNGFHLEAKLVDIFKELPNTTSLEEALEDDDTLVTEDGSLDPHIWFSITNWKKAANHVRIHLSSLNPKDSSLYQDNYDNYIKELEALDAYSKNMISNLPKDKRVLVTAHDAFNYFAKSYDFNVVAIQGISTEAEASTQSISAIADYIAQNKIPAIFTESSMSPKTIQSLKDAVSSRGFEVHIGEELYSDSLKINSNYIETYRSNVDNIVNALR